MNDTSIKTPFTTRVEMTPRNQVHITVHVLGFGESCYTLQEGLSCQQDEEDYMNWLFQRSAEVEMLLYARSVPTHEFEGIIMAIKLQVDHCIGRLATIQSFSRNFQN